MKYPPLIILTGFMGSGKTSTGKELAKLIHFDFLDTDHWIEEKNKKTIPQIFKESGEAFFRLEEKMAMIHLQGLKKAVISTGGGLWLDEMNRNELLSRGFCIWLRVSPEVAWKRIQAHTGQRPLLEEMQTPLTELTQMIEKRNPIYELAHANLSTDGKDPRQVAIKIVKMTQTENLMELS